ncbi:unnamed protein product [Polarella glacialis]|uniref:Uncharacterized protein n=1 Tax=Polarella glacialis TaxID=89957 RepID=A0A813DMP0_POLGL|nr:unnamed protein product [Polarella glacialis]
MWLYHRNMVGLMPSWTHMFQTGLADKYDWFINVEFDHFLSPARSRATIAAYVEGLKQGDAKDAEGPIMIMWGNAYVFNKKLVLAMRDNWEVLGKVADRNGSKDEAKGVGCPLFQKGHQEWPGACSQDIVYPTLANDILPHIQVKVAAPGDPGCGNQPYPLGCWEMQQNPFNGESHEGELQAIRELAAMGGKSREQALEYCEKQGGVLSKNCMKFWDGRSVPIIHHLHRASEHALARKLLDNDDDPLTGTPTVVFVVVFVVVCRCCLSTTTATTTTTTTTATATNKQQQ